MCITKWKANNIYVYILNENDAQNICDHSTHLKCSQKTREAG